MTMAQSGSDPGAADSPVGGAAPDRTASGSAFALVAFLSWGLLVPVHFRAIVGVPALELLAHRIAWSVPLLLACAAFLRTLRPTLRALADRRTLALLLCTSILIGINWLVFLVAVQSHRLLDVSLGYFINPLVNIGLGVLVLRERLRPAQGVAVAIAGASVAFLVLASGHLPVVALLLATTFGTYGLLRKLAKVDAVGGLLVETLVLAPFALAGLSWLVASGGLEVSRADTRTQALVALAGAVTAIPLLSFVAAARRLTLVAVGFFQYLAPTGQLLLAVLAWGEPLDGTRLAAFAGIWLALGVVSVDALLAARRSVAARRSLAT